MEIGNNIKTEFSFFDKSIKEKNCQCYKLFAHYNTNSFSFTIFNMENEEFLGLKSFIFDQNEDNLNYLLRESNVFKWSLNSLTLNYFNTTCTLVPNSLFDEKFKRKYLEINSPVEKEDEILIDKLKHINAVVIYSIPQKHLNALRKIKNIKIKHSATIFLESILEQSKQSTKSNFFIDVSTKSFNIAFVKNSKLIFYNNFKFKSKNDFLYYVLNCFNTLDINSKEVELIISGEFKKDEVINDLKMYIKKIKLETRPINYLFSHTFNDVPNHYFHKLFNQIKCE